MKYLVKKNGFSLLELMVAIAILLVITGGIYVTMNTGKESFISTEANMRLRNNLVSVIERVSAEVRNSGSDADGTMKLSIANNLGVNGTDILKFSVPIVCEADGSMIDTNGDVANWGAPLTWGCKDSSCMDADNDCSTSDYVEVWYLLNAKNELRRIVIPGVAGIPIHTDIFAQNITNFQASLSADNNVVTLDVTASITTDTKKVVTTSESVNIYLRNRG